MAPASPSPYTKDSRRGGVRGSRFWNMSAKPKAIDLANHTKFTDESSLDRQQNRTFRPEWVFQRLAGTKTRNSRRKRKVHRRRVPNIWRPSKTNDLELPFGGNGPPTTSPQK